MFHACYFPPNLICHTLTLGHVTMSMWNDKVNKRMVFINIIIHEYNKTWKNNIILQFWVEETPFEKKSKCVTYHEIDISTLTSTNFWELTHYDFQILWQYISKHTNSFFKIKKGWKIHVPMSHTNSRYRSEEIAPDPGNLFYLNFFLKM